MLWPLIWLDFHNIISVCKILLHLTLASKSHISHKMETSISLQRTEHAMASSSRINKQSMSKSCNACIRQYLNRCREITFKNFHFHLFNILYSCKYTVDDLKICNSGNSWTQKCCFLWTFMIEMSSIGPVNEIQELHVVQFE